MILSGIVEKKIFLLLFVLSSIYIHAQQFGGNPPSLKWKQIDTDTARVIFPAGLEAQARDVATVIHRLASIPHKRIGPDLRKINIVLQNQPTSANGYVSLGPFRSEFFLTPRQNSFELGSLPWHKSLALHEYRHVQQFSNYRKGVSKAFYYVFGEEGQSFANSLVVPDWFWEGDAVYNETLLSDQGRGRLPFFFNDYRSLWASNKNYSWMKLRNGSYRDLVPNHYQLGYMLVSYGYDKYGADFWKRVTGDAVRFKGFFYPFQKAVKKYSGQSYISFTNEAIRHFKEQDKTTSRDSAGQFGASQKHFSGNEEYPQWIDSSNIVMLKSDFKRIPAFYTRNISTGDERKIRNKSISSDTYFSYNNGKIVYSAYRPHPRWGWKNYEVIKIINVSTGAERSITTATRFLSPDISKDGKLIIAVNSSTSGTNNLELINGDNGTTIQKIPNKDSLQFTFPKFYDDRRIVSAVRNNRGEMALGLFAIEDGTAEWLTPFSMNVIAFPNVSNDTIAFSMMEGHHDRLFIVTGGKVFRFETETGQSTGNYQLALNNRKYVWTSFTSAGYHVFTGSGTLKGLPGIDKSENNLYSLELQHRVNVINDPQRNYRVKNYSPSFQLFNFHSWRPFISDPEYSYSLTSENILNTLRSDLYFTYNRNENFKETGAQLSYGGWFPVVSGGAAFTFDRSFTDTARVIRWNEFNALAGLSVPLAFTSGTYYQNLNVSGTFNTKQVFYTGASKNEFPDKRFNYAEWTFSGTNQQLRARQNIYPRFAQSAFARYRHILNNYTANQFLLSGTLYLPGVARNHNLIFQAAYQRRDTMQQYTFSNSFPLSRGYSDIDFPRMWKIGSNYHFPIIYPDEGFANIVYILRIRGNIFYDYSEVKSLRTGLVFPFRTAGAEVYFDTKWWNQLPLSFGIRFNRLLDGDLVGLSSNQWEIILPMNLLSR